MIIMALLCASFRCVTSACCSLLLCCAADLQNDSMPAALRYEFAARTGDGSSEADRLLHAAGTAITPAGSSRPHLSFPSASSDTATPPRRLSAAILQPATAPVPAAATRGSITK